MEFDLIKQAFNRHSLDNYKYIYNCKFNLVMTHSDINVENVTSQELFIRSMYRKFMNCYPENFISDFYINDSPNSNLKLWHI